MKQMQAQIARNTVVLATLARAVHALRVTDVRCTALKGAALLAGRIVPLYERHLDDLDLWVPPARAHAAFEALLRDGFQILPGPPSTTHAGEDGVDAPTHQLPMLRSPHGTFVELHLESHGQGEAGDFDACFAAGDDVDVFGVAVRVPSPLHLLEQLCAHVVVHHFGDLRYWPRHANDVRRLVERAPELAALRRRPDEVGLSLRVAHGALDANSSDAWLAPWFLRPTSSMQSAWRAVGLGVRAARFARRAPRDFRHVLLPSRGHLAFTGDLVEGGSLLDAQVRRWRRIARRALRPD